MHSLREGLQSVNKGMHSLRKRLQSVNKGMHSLREGLHSLKREIECLGKSINKKGAINRAFTLIIIIHFIPVF